MMSIVRTSFCMFTTAVTFFSPFSSYHRYHSFNRRNAASRIYLRNNGELLKYKPRFYYTNHHALFVASVGETLSSREVLSALSAYDEFYENEQW